jgi:hypothetical protein
MKDLIAVKDYMFKDNNLDSGIKIVGINKAKDGGHIVSIKKINISSTETPIQYVLVSNYVKAKEIHEQLKREEWEI